MKNNIIRIMELLDQKLIQQLAEVRQDLHKHPELSHEEVDTSARVMEWLTGMKPDNLLTLIGGNGVAAVWDSGNPGPAVLFRCELDALPIQETGDISYLSINEGVGHLCGHDGHMAIMLGLSSFIMDHRPARGRVILLFQPAEETGRGAAMVLEDETFKKIAPDYAFAIHNLPGFPMHQVVMADPVFSAGSVGMEIELTGKTSHAAEPENGINPAVAVSRIIQLFNDISRHSEIFDEYVLITIIQVLLGEKAFGTSAGHAVLRATLRAFNERDFLNLINYARSEAERIGKNEGLAVKISTTEEFPVTVNSAECNALIKRLASENNWPLTWLDKPFRWSEDFGHYPKICKSALIGLGAGIDQPKLHHPDYDFPDELIPSGILLFSTIYHEILIK